MLEPSSAGLTIIGINLDRTADALEGAAGGEGETPCFDVVLSDAVKIEINQTYPLAETAQAHRDLEARKTTGSTILKP